MKIYENVNLAKSILRKKGLDTTDENYLKLIEIVGSKKGWLGFITKLFFIEEVDLLEIEHIFGLLVKHSADLGKISKMNYTQLSDFLYDLENEKTGDHDFKYLFSDGYYMYFEVYTYEGILEIGSPAWCLKTKKYWREYNYDNTCRQFVVIKKGKKLLTPNTNYLSRYRNEKRGYLRYGITLQNNAKKYHIFDDGDKQLGYDSNHLIEKITENIRKYIDNKPIEKWKGVQESEGLVKLDTGKNSEFYFLKNWECAKRFDDQVPFNDVFSKNTTIKSKNKLLIGGVNKNIQLVLCFSEYGVFIYSDQNITHGFADSNISETQWIQESIKEIIEKNMVDYQPFTLLPIKVKLGLSDIEQIKKNHDNFYYTDTTYYQCYRTVGEDFCIQAVDITLKSTESIRFYYYNKKSKSWVSPEYSQTSNGEDVDLKKLDWSIDGDILKEIYNDYFENFKNPKGKGKDSWVSKFGKFISGK